MDQNSHRPGATSFLKVWPFHIFGIVIKVELGYNRAGYEGGSMMTMNKHSCLEIEKGALNDNMLVSELRTKVVGSQGQCLFPRSSTDLPYSDLANGEDVEYTKKYLFLDDGTAITALEKLGRFLTDGWEHVEDQKAVNVLKVTYVHISLKDRTIITDLWSLELSKMTKYVCWKQNILNEKIFLDLCKAIEADTIDLAKGKDSHTNSRPQIASIGSNGIISNHFQIFVKAPMGKTTFIWAHATDSVTDLKQNIANHIGYLFRDKFP